MMLDDEFRHVSNVPHPDYRFNPLIDRLSACSRRTVDFIESAKYVQEMKMITNAVYYDGPPSFERILLET